MAVEEEKWQNILEELKSSEIKDCVPCAEELKKKSQSLHSDVLDFLTYVVKSLPSKKPRTDQANQAADNTETSQPDSPEEEDKPDDMDPKSEPPAAKNMETSPSQPDCSIETSVNREEEEQSAVSLQAAESDSGENIKEEQHSANDTELSPNNQSDSHHQKKIQKEKMAVDEDKCQKFQRELKRSEIKDCVPYQHNQAADNTETSQPDSPEEEDKPDGMDPKSEPPAAANMETSPSQPDCSKETSVNREQEEEEEEEEQSAVSLRAAESNSGKNIKRLHSANDTELSPDNQSDSHRQKKIQQREMAVDKEKCPKILREQKSSEIKDCVPRAENLKAKKAFQPNDAVVDSLPSKKPKTASWVPTVTFSCVVTGETFDAHKTIVEKVKKRSWTLTTRVETTENVQECDIIIFFCPITSRIGSDVEAVKKHAAVSSNNKPVIVVLMHHTRDRKYPCEERKWFEDPRFVLEVHVLFHQTQRGLLQCPHNDQAVSKIQQELYRHSKSLWSSS